MGYLINEQLKEISANKQDRLFTDEMLFALIADVVLAGKDIWKYEIDILWKLKRTMS